MGIPGLLPSLKSISRPTHVREYAGKRVAVDTYSWLHKGALSCSKDLVEGRPNEKYINYCMHRVNLLRHHGIIPVLVFDGGLLPMKAQQETKRDRFRREFLAKAVEHERSGNHASAFDFYQKAVDITPAIAFQLIKVLKQQHIEYIVAPYEADAQMAYLSIYGHVHAVITEDSDMIPYACPRVLYKMDKFGQGVEIKYEDLSKNKELNFTNFTKQMVLEMCILSGCDYLPSLPGLGVKKAHALIRRLKTYKKVIKNLVFSGITVPKDYEESFEKAILTFRHQCVYDPEKQDVVHLHPPESHENTDLAFAGPKIAVDLARAIAHGEVDPLTRKRFQDDQQERNATVPRKQSPERKARMPFKHKSNLPVQKNDLSKYFVPVSAAAKRSFIPPRPAKEDYPSSQSPSPVISPWTPLFNSVDSREEDCLAFSPPERRESPDFGSPGSSFSPFDRFNKPTAHTFADSGKDHDWNPRVKRRRPSSGGKVANLDIFRLGKENNFTPPALPLSLSPEWRVAGSQDEAILFQESEPLETLEIASSVSDLDDFSDAYGPKGNDSCGDIFGEDAAEEVEPIESQEGDEADAACIEAASPLGTPDDVTLVTPTPCGSNGNSVLRLPALQSFSTNVSHIQEYSKIGHKALDAFESSLGLSKYSSIPFCDGSVGAGRDHGGKTRNSAARHVGPSSTLNLSKGGADLYIEAFGRFAHTASPPSPRSRHARTAQWST